MKNAEHAYAIVRVDLFQGPETPLEQKVTVTKVLWDFDFAKEEVERLNLLNKGSVYFWQTTRVELRVT